MWGNKRCRQFCCFRMAGKLATLLQGFDPKDIYNGDEIGLFFRALPTKSLALKGEKCTGGKISKERLFFLSQYGGQLLKPLVIGEAARPRSFRHLHLKKLPVIWRSNRRAWMTAALMEELLNNFNSQMKENCHVLLFIDNATCYPHIDLSNVKLAWFPPNTGVTQSMDQDVIYTMKTHLPQTCVAVDHCTNGQFKKCKLYCEIGFSVGRSELDSHVNKKN